jgi:hypothetical protein
LEARSLLLLEAAILRLLQELLRLLLLRLSRISSRLGLDASSWVSGVLLL